MGKNSEVRGTHNWRRVRNSQNERREMKKGRDFPGRYVNKKNNQKVHEFRHFDSAVTYAPNGPYCGKICAGIGGYDRKKEETTGYGGWGGAENVVKGSWAYPGDYCAWVPVKRQSESSGELVRGQNSADKGSRRRNHILGGAIMENVTEF